MSQIRSAWFFGLLLVLCMELTLACNKAVVIAEYPVDHEDVNAGLRLPSDDGEGYWSAYVRIENQDIPFLWKTNDLDYALISIEVTIPTRKGPLVRTIPLFTLEHGVPQAESGVDLLKKIPLTREAREQVSFRLQVTYLKNKEALDTARKILDRVENLAKPFLANYPMASQIIETSLGLIGDSVESREGASSSMVTVVDVDSVVQQAERSRDGSSMLQAYFLLPMDLRLFRGRGKNKESKEQCSKTGKVEYCGVKNWLDKLIGDQLIVECADFRGRLCVASEHDDADLEQLITTKTDQAEEKIDQLLVDNEAWFNRSLSPEFELAEFVTWIIQHEERPVRYDDIPTTFIAKLQPVADRLNQFAKEYEHCNESMTLELPASADEPRSTETMSCERADAVYSDVVDRLHSLVQMTLDETEELLGMQQTATARTKRGTTKYRKDRLDSIVYVTIRFERYDNVYDPLALIPGSREDCGAITPASIESTQEYFSANVDFFRENDADKIRQLLRGAREYLQIKDLVEKGSYIEAARALGKADALRRIRQQMTADTGEATLLDSHVWSVGECFDELERRPPLHQLANLWRLYLRDDETSTSSWNLRRGCGAQTSSAQRLDQLAFALKEFAKAIDDSDGLELQETGPGAGTATMGVKSKGFSIASILLEEAEELFVQQLKRLSALPPKDCEAAAKEVIHFSAACKACFTQLTTVCTGNELELSKIFKAEADAQTCARYGFAP